MQVFVDGSDVDPEDGGDLALRLPLSREFSDRLPTLRNRRARAPQAFFDAHESCPDRVEHHVWLPRGLDEASITMTCACGGRIVIPCTRVEGQALVASFMARGVPVTTSDAAEGVH